MSTQRDLMTIIQRIVARETIFLRHYIGKVLNNDCSTTPGLTGSGMIQVAIHDLGIDTPDNAFWCYPRDKNSLITPKLGSWVEVYFINGDRNRAVYMGKANEINNQIAQNYDGKSTTQLLFEDNRNQINIKFDELNNLLEIGKTDLQFAARLNDETLSDSSTDSAFWTWLATTLITWANSHTHPVSGALAGPTAIPLSSSPNSQTGKINTASSQTKIGG